MLHHMGLVGHFYVVVSPAYVCLGLYSLIVGEPSYRGQHAQSHEDIVFDLFPRKSAIGAETSYNCSSERFKLLLSFTCCHQIDVS